MTIAQSNSSSVASGPPAAATLPPASSGLVASTKDITRSRSLPAAFELHIEKQITKFIAWAVGSVLLVALGAMGATVWQLNGAIYQAVGKQSESGTALETLKNRVQVLEKENEAQKKTVACFSNPTVKDKRGCIYGN